MPLPSPPRVRIVGEECSGWADEVKGRRPSRLGQRRGKNDFLYDQRVYFGIFSAMREISKNMNYFVRIRS